MLSHGAARGKRSTSSLDGNYRFIQTRPLIIMRHYLLTLLAVITLLSQWGWVEHAYHDHDHNEVCEVCLNASTHDHALTTSLPSPHAEASFAISEQLSTQLLAQRPVRYYASRAPPYFL